MWRAGEEGMVEIQTLAYQLSFVPSSTLSEDLKALVCMLTTVRGPFPAFPVLVNGPSFHPVRQARNTAPHLLHFPTHHQDC